METGQNKWQKNHNTFIFGPFLVFIFQPALPPGLIKQAVSVRFGSDPAQEVSPSVWGRISR